MPGYPGTTFLGCFSALTASSFPAPLSPSCFVARLADRLWPHTFHVAVTRLTPNGYEVIAETVPMRKPAAPSRLPEYIWVSLDEVVLPEEGRHAVTLVVDGVALVTETLGAIRVPSGVPR